MAPRPPPGRPQGRRTRPRPARLPIDYLARDTANKPQPAPGPSALAFYQANDLKPETVASGAARILLGIKIECAQCHDHPFDKWTRQQFWQTAAFSPRSRRSMAT